MRQTATTTVAQARRCRVVRPITARLSLLNPYSLHVQDLPSRPRAPRLSAMLSGQLCAAVREQVE
jgi:hypothetical protein